MHLLPVDVRVVLPVAGRQHEAARRRLDAALHEIRLDPGDAPTAIDLLAVRLEHVERRLVLVEDPGLLENLEGRLVDQADVPGGKHGHLRSRRHRRASRPAAKLRPDAPFTLPQCQHGAALRSIAQRHQSML